MTRKAPVLALFGTVPVLALFGANGGDGPALPTGGNNGSAWLGATTNLSDENDKSGAGCEGAGGRDGVGARKGARKGTAKKPAAAKGTNSGTKAASKKTESVTAGWRIPALQEEEEEEEDLFGSEDDSEDELRLDQHKKQQHKKQRKESPAKVFACHARARWSALWEANDNQVFEDDVALQQPALALQGSAKDVGRFVLSPLSAYP